MEPMIVFRGDGKELIQAHWNMLLHDETLKRIALYGNHMNHVVTRIPNGWHLDVILNPYSIDGKTVNIEHDYIDGALVSNYSDLSNRLTKVTEVGDHIITYI